MHVSLGAATLRIYYHVEARLFCSKRAGFGNFVLHDSKESSRIELLKVKMLVTV